MKLLISLDYELYFGSNTGSIERCLILPTNALAEILMPYHTKLSFFVDVGFLCALKQQGKHNSSLMKQYDQVARHLDLLARRGHDIQLHVHPHWEDSFFRNDEWSINIERYRLQDFEAAEQINIVNRYKETLQSLTDKPVFAYRAGGWCLQPYEQIHYALKQANVWLDSTVYYQGISSDPIRWFDFTQSIDKDFWYFSTDPVQEDLMGESLEVPISSVLVNPLFFWKMVVIKKILKNKNHMAYGNGKSMIADKRYYLRLLSQFSYSVVSIDGLKVDLVEKALNQKIQANADLLNVMGHPKSLTPYSITRFGDFVNKYQDLLEPITYQHFLGYEKSGASR